MRVAVGAWKHREAIARLGEAMAPDPSCAFVHGAYEGGFSGLDPGTRHCLVDTMALLPTCQGDPGVIGDAKLELHGAALIPLDRIISEAAHRHGRQGGGHRMADPGGSVSFLPGLPKSGGTRFKLVRVEQSMHPCWRYVRLGFMEATRPWVAGRDDWAVTFR